MPGPARADAPREGTVFAVPLDGREHVLGIVIERFPHTVRVGMNVEPVPELPSSASMDPSDLGMLTQVQASALDAGEWPVVGVVDGFDPHRWPNPPMLPGDTPGGGQTPAAMVRSVTALVRDRRRRALEDRTWLAEHPELADPIVGTRYLRLPAGPVVPFLETRLADAGTLGRLVLERADWAAGTFISTLPEEVGVETAVTNPDWGGKVWDRGRGLVRAHHVYPDGRRAPVHDDFRSAHTMITDWLASGSTHVAVFRDPFVDAADAGEFTRASAHVNAPGRELRRYADESYQVMTPAAAADESFADDVLHRPPWAQTGFLSDASVAGEGPDLTRDDLMQAADGLEAVVLGAYDGDGYVVWTRTNGNRWLTG